jgi:hypothetical protein
MVFMCDLWKREIYELGHTYDRKLTKALCFDFQDFNNDNFSLTMH